MSDETKELELYSQVILDSPKPKIRLEAFVEKYLPLLFDEDPSKFNLAWINDVAKSPYMEVEAINKNNKVEYVIPPLRKQHAASLGNELPMMAQMAHLEHNIHPIKGLAYLSNVLPTVVRFEKNLIDADIELRWKEILIKHGYGSRLADSNVKKPGSVLSDPDSNVGLSEDMADW